jgi:uncharacterized membrane protein
MKKKSELTFLDKFVGLIAVILVIALVLGCLAGKIDPRDNKYIPFFGLAYPYLLILNVAIIIWWLLRKRWSFAFLTSFVILIGWQAFNASIGFSGNKGEGL